LSSGFLCRVVLGLGVFIKFFGFGVWWFLVFVGFGMLGGCEGLVVVVWIGVFGCWCGGFGFGF